MGKVVRDAMWTRINELNRLYCESDKAQRQLSGKSGHDFMACYDRAQTYKRAYEQLRDSDMGMPDDDEFTA